MEIRETPRLTAMWAVFTGEVEGVKVWQTFKIMCLLVKKKKERKEKKKILGVIQMEKPLLSGKM